MDNSNEEIKEEIKEETAEETAPVKKKKEKEKKSAAQEVFEWVEIIALSLSFVLMMFSYVARQAVVDGGSMEVTFHEGESIVVSNLFYTPKQGDVVVFQVPEGSHTTYPIITEPIIKRVIAVGGQTVYIDFDNWKVYVYDDSSLTVDEVLATVEPLDEPYIEPMRQAYYKDMPITRDRNTRTYPLTVEEGMLFCMGDNRNGSSDSRSVLGPVDSRYVLGKVIFRIWPFSVKF